MPGCPQFYSYNHQDPSKKLSLEGSKDATKNSSDQLGKDLQTKIKRWSWPKGPRHSQQGCQCEDWVEMVEAT
jgi:hypothetical protein